MPSNPSNELLKEYVRVLDRRQPCRKSLLRACPFGFPHKGILSLGLSKRENIGRRFEVCCTPTRDDQPCFFHGTPSRSQPSCEALADLFAYIASLEVAPWGDEAFVDFACASTIAFNHRAAQARTDPPNALQRHWLAFQRAFPPYVDLPAYQRTVPAVEPPLMVTPITFAGLLSDPLPRKTGLLPQCDHRVKVRVALYQINNYEASLLDCVGIKRGAIVEFTLRQTGIFKELGIQDTDRRVLASLQIYLPAQAKWSRAPRPSDKLHLAVGEGVIYRLPHVHRTPALAQLIAQIIPRALFGGGAPLPALLAYSLQLEQANDVPPQAATSSSALASVVSASASTSAVVHGTRAAEGSTCSSFTIRKIHRHDRASAASPISKARRGPRLSTPPLSAPVAGVKATTTHGLRRASSAQVERSKAVIDLSEDINDVADDIINKSARFWQHYLKAGASSRCLRAEGTESNPINLMDVGSEFEYAKEDAP